MSVFPISPPKRLVELQIDGESVRAPEGTTILDALRRRGVDTPTLCYLDNLSPVNVCRVCVVEVEGSRVLVPSCSRKVEAGMVVKTDTERVKHSRKLVLELLASSVDLSLVNEDTRRWMAEYGAEPEKFGPPVAPSAPGERDASHTGHHHAPEGDRAETVAQPVKVDNDLYVRDYSKCILCYKCVEACGEDAQFTFAIGVAGRGFEAHIDTGFDAPLAETPCVYCGNCVAVCPTGALMGRTEWDLRRQDAWKPDEQTTQDTICPYCGVGCGLRVTSQDARVVKVESPRDHPVTRGFLCVKGRF